MPKGVDLKLTKEDALRELKRAADDAIDGVKRTAEKLGEELAQVAVVPNPNNRSIATATIACVIDLEIGPTMEYQTNHQLNLNIGPYGGYVDIRRNITKGQYRAIILIDRIGD